MSLEARDIKRERDEKSSRGGGGGIYPRAGPHIEIGRMHQSAGNSHCIVKRPQARDASVKQVARYFAALDNRHKSVDGNGKDKTARGQVARGDKPALGPARPGAHLQGIMAERLDIK